MEVGGDINSLHRAWQCALVVAALSVGLAAPAGAQNAQAEPTTDAPDLAVIATQPWTPTGVTLRAGDEVALGASGVVNFGVAPIDQMAPTGLPWGPQCETSGPHDSEFPAPGLNCYSLVARVGDGAPVAVGSGATVVATADGELQLGINDNNFGDNSGTWTVAIGTSGARVGAPAPAPPAEDAPESSEGGGGVATIALAGVALLALLGLIVWLRKRGARGPAFALPATLLAGRIDVRISSDRSIWRVGATGELQPFMPFTADFGPVGVEGRRPTFTWRDLEFTAVRSPVRVGRHHGEVAVPGAYVSASGGMVLSPDRRTRGVLPLSLPGAWVFTLVSVDVTAAESDRPAEDGYLTMFIRDDQPFRQQTDAIVASFRGFLEDLDRLAAQRDAGTEEVRADEVPATVE
jgi:hypothetical protein